ncbi:MAG: nitroreductase family protein [Terracidiphilus sp.]
MASTAYETLTLSADEVDRLKHAPQVEGVLPVFHRRWSPRSFADREVNPALLAKVFEAARWAASSFNEQPWRFFLGPRGSEIYRKIYDSLTEHNRAWAGSAPVLILGVAKSTFSHNGSPNRVALYDLGAAASYMTLQAAALGLATHQMAGVDLDKARKNLDIPEDYIVGAAIALGYQGEPSKLKSEQMLKQETAPRQRKPLSQIVLAGWGEPAKLG